MNLGNNVLLVFFNAALMCFTFCANSKACSSPIYCSGPLLDLVQRSKVLKSSIEFVTRPTKKPLASVMKSFDFLKNNNPTKLKIKEFIDSNFLEKAKEVKEYEIKEFKKSPEFLNKIKNKHIKEFASHINYYWKNLSKIQDLSYLCNNCVTSLLPAKNAFVVPGGRFQEAYYWDSYFTMKGLFLSELNGLSKGMILNFLQYVETYGFVPNGQRVFYLNRSQPPFLIPMVMDYYKATADLEFVKQSLPTLEKEYNYWIREHSVKVPCSLNKSDYNANCSLTRYIVNNSEPRPESYTDDIETVENSTLSTQQKSDLYADLATGAETGWDYSTRWTQQKQKRNSSDYNNILRTLRTRQIVPVDLNSFMYNNEVTLSKMYDLTNKDKKPKTKSNYYLQKAKRRAEIMHNIMLYDGLFYDFDLSTLNPTKQYTQASYTPFYTGCLTEDFKKNTNNYIKAYKKLTTDKYGLPATLYDSGLQWDYPNVWAPLVYFVIEGASKSSQSIKTAKNSVQDLKNAKILNDLSLNLTNVFIKSVYCTYLKNNKLIFEKYNSHVIGSPGEGGEYDVQSGFGWSNGVILHLVNKFGDKLESSFNTATAECSFSLLN